MPKRKRKYVIKTSRHERRKVAGTILRGGLVAFAGFDVARDFFSRKRQIERDIQHINRSSLARVAQEVRKMIQ